MTFSRLRIAVPFYQALSRLASWVGTYCRVGFLSGLVVLSAGCVSVDAARYYTLQQTPDLSSSGSQHTESGVSRAAAPVSAVPFLISLQPVVMPEQLDRLQIVVTEPGSTRVYPLESSLWVAPLSREFRSALSAHLQTQLQTLDVELMQLPQGRPVWKIMTSVQRFESLYEQRAVLELTWTLEPLNMEGFQTHVCGARTEVKVGSGMSALVQGHQEALERLAHVIAAQIRTNGKVPAAYPGVDIKACR